MAVLKRHARLIVAGVTFSLGVSLGQCSWRVRQVQPHHSAKR